MWARPKKKNQHIKYWLRLMAIGLVTTTLGACGGGGGGSGKDKIDVNGAANIGASLTGVVRIYEVDADGVDRSNDLANAMRTSIAGGFSLEISDTNARALYIEVQSDGELSITCGAEICERQADGSTAVSYGDTYTPSKTISLSGMVSLRDNNDDPLDSVTANLSVLSTIAASLAQSKATAGVRLDDIVRETNDQVADRFDIQGDLLSIPLVDTSSTEDINQAGSDSLRDSLKATGLATASLINGNFNNLGDAINGVVQQFIDIGIADRENAPSPTVTLEEALEAAISLLDLLKTVEGVNVAGPNFQTAEAELTEAEQEAQSNGSTIPSQGGIDTDGDGMLDISDPDDDNDGVEDASDAFPLEPNESLDTDGDGTGNNADQDDDNDGVDDINDAFPLDPNESADTDSDGTGNNADQDDDNDGVNDSDDAFPLDETESSDLDKDGVGDNSDPDSDGDGVANDIDNCPFVTNPEQENTDGDEFGDACDGGDGAVWNQFNWDEANWQ